MHRRPCRVRVCNAVNALNFWAKHAARDCGKNSMNMDLSPSNPSTDTSQLPEDYPMASGRVCVLGDKFVPGFYYDFVMALKEWGVDVSEFSYSNGGFGISVATYKRVTNVLEARLETISGEERDRLKMYLAFWHMSNALTL